MSRAPPNHTLVDQALVAQGPRARWRPASPRRGQRKTIEATSLAAALPNNVAAMHGLSHPQPWGAHLDGPFAAAHRQFTDGTPSNTSPVQ